MKNIGGLGFWGFGVLGQPEPGTRIRAGVTEVNVPVTVTDGKGRYISNLEAKDFRILDEGQPQRITYFSHEQKQAIVVGFLLDLSSSSSMHWKNYQDAMLELVWAVASGDDPRYSGYLITYGNTAQLRVNTTHDNDKIVDAIRKAKTGGGPLLMMPSTRPAPIRWSRATLRAAAHHHHHRRWPRQFEQAERGRGSGTGAARPGYDFAMSTQAFGFNDESQGVLERLTGETGGHVEYPLNSLYKDVARYLRTPATRATTRTKSAPAVTRGRLPPESRAPCRVW